MRALWWLRAGLVTLAVVQVATGAWQFLAPRAFFDLRWVALFPPYNEHLMRDLGSLNLALALVLGVAAVSMERRLVRTALLADLVYTLPHLVFHALHLEPYTPADAVAQQAALTLTVVAPLALLALTARLPDEPARRHRDAPPVGDQDGPLAGAHDGHVRSEGVNDGAPGYRTHVRRPRSRP